MCLNRVFPLVRLTGQVAYVSRSKAFPTPCLPYEWLNPIMSCDTVMIHNHLCRCKMQMVHNGSSLIRSHSCAGIFLDCLRLNVKVEDPCPNCVSQWIQNMEIMYSCTCFEPLFLKSVKSKLFALPAMVI